MNRLCRRFLTLGNTAWISQKANQDCHYPLGLAGSFMNFRGLYSGANAQNLPLITDKSSNSSMIREGKDVGILSSLMGSRSSIHSTAGKEDEKGGVSRPMDFVRGVLEDDIGNYYRSPQLAQHNEEKLDIVHIKLIKNNTFVTVTDSKGNKKAGASSGCLEEMKGGPKVSRYAAEATAEHVGRLSKNLGLKSVVMRVNGFTHFKKKKQAILSWREGFTSGRGDRNPIVFIEDTTRRPHNGCRLRKRRRI
ncbi:Small ribosomal subunit protein uS11m-like protein [Drosera capensis]